MPEPVLIYDGPMPQRPTDYYELCQPAWNRRFIYMLMSEDGLYVYIGRSFQPGTRFDRHRRRAWWEFVTDVRIYEVLGSDAQEADALVDMFERAAIQNLDPVFNIAGVAA